MPDAEAELAVLGAGFGGTLTTYGLLSILGTGNRLTVKFGTISNTVAAATKFEGSIRRKV